MHGRQSQVAGKLAGAKRVQRIIMSKMITIGSTGPNFAAHTSRADDHDVKPEMSAGRRGCTKVSAYNMQQIQRMMI